MTEEMETKVGSKSNLNESVLPLLDECKEKIELKDHSKSSSDSSDDSSVNKTGTDKTDADEAKKRKEEEKKLKQQKKLEEEERKKQKKLEKKKKKEEEKELKKQKKVEKQAALEAAKANGDLAGNDSDGKNWNRLNQFSVGINLLDRDEKSINDHVNISFEDVIGEPDATQGFNFAYQLSFGLFQFVRFWVYRILMAVVALPLALIWALIFSILSLLSVWLITPGFRVMDIIFYFVHRVWSCLVRTFLDPIFISVALLKQNQSKPFHQTPIATTSGRTYIYNDGVKYSKVNSNDATETYKTSNEEDISEEQVTVAVLN